MLCLACFIHSDLSKSPSISVISTKQGMYSLWRFLQGTAGERSWLFWLDAERLKYCSSKQEQSWLDRVTHFSIVYCLTLLYSLLRTLRERYLTPGAPLELPADTRFRVGVTRLELGGVTNVQSLQNMMSDNLKHYWYVNVLPMITMCIAH